MDPLLAAETKLQGPARFRDPLGHYRTAEIVFVVRDFAIKYGFITERELDSGETILDRYRKKVISEEDLEILGTEGRLALVALLERGFELGRDRRFNDLLSEEDLRALELEKRGSLLGQSWHLYCLIWLCSMGGQLQGWDQMGSAAANVTWPTAFKLDPWTGKPIDAFKVAAVNAMPYLIAPLGCLLSDPINNWLGRRKTIFIAAVFCFFSVIGCAVTRLHLRDLLACRALLGIGMGLKASTVPLLSSESAPYRIRGSLVMSWQVNVTVGILCGSLANLIIFYCKFKAASWRYQLGCAFIPAVPVMCGVLFIPDSPVWFLRTGDVQGAYGTLRKLRPRPIIACRDLLIMYHANRIEQSLMKTPQARGFRAQWKFLRAYVQRMKELFSIPRNRRATQASLAVMVTQQFSGINIIVFYCTTVLLGDRFKPLQPDLWIPGSETYENVKRALIVSAIFALCNFLFSFPAVKTIDKFGRLTLLLITLPFTAVSLMGLSLAFWKIPSVTGSHDWPKYLCIFLFTAWYSPGSGAVPFTYAAEVFPNSHRDVGMSLSVAVNLFFAGLMTLGYVPLERASNRYRALGIFASFNVVAFVLVALFVVETKQVPLEVLTERFSHSTRELVRRRLSTLPNLYRARRQKWSSDEEKTSERARQRLAPEAGIELSSRNPQYNAEPYPHHQDDSSYILPEIENESDGLGFHVEIMGK